MKDKGLYIIIAVVFFSPSTLLFYIEWYWVLLIYNIFWAVLCYGAHSEAKNPKISARNTFLIPLFFNLIGVGYVALKLYEGDDETAEPTISKDEVEAAKSRLRENILGGSTIEDKIENLIIDGNKVKKTLSYYPSGKLKKEEYTGEDNLGREIYTYKVYFESGCLRAERDDEREDIKWAVTEYYESGRIKKRESKYSLDKSTGNGYFFNEYSRDDLENSKEEVYCYGINKVSVFFDESSSELPSNNSKYEIEAENALRKFFYLKKAKKQESDNKESDEKVKLYITKEPILVAKNIFDEFNYKYGHYLVNEENDKEIVFESDIDEAVDVIKLLDPIGKYFLHNEFGVSYDNGSWTTLYELSFINCEIPKFLQDKYDGQLLIEDNSENEIKYALSNSVFFEKIVKSFSENNIEIEDGVECFKYDDFNFQKFFRYASETNESSETTGDYKSTSELKSKEREILSHEIMTKGAFIFENKKGEYLEVFGQRHTLISETQAWDEKNEEWEDVGEREEIDDFHLTDYEKGYQFSEDDLCKFFEIDDWPDWDCNGVSFDWCGIEDDDDNETRQKKWDDYKSKFPKATSIEHFDIENKKS